MNKLLTLVLAVFLFGSQGLQAAVAVPGPLVETDWLAANLDKVVILDVRKDVASFKQPAKLAKDKKTGKLKVAAVGGHITGAHLIDYKKVRADRKVDTKKVIGMLPEPAEFEKLLRGAGANSDSTIVIVSKGMSNEDMTMATRLYWELKYYGHDNMAILNGGMAQWLVDGRETTLSTTAPLEGNWSASARHDEILASSDDVAAAIGKADVQLIDNRPLSLYLGTWKKSYVYDTGHIPGAKPFPNELMTSTSAPARFPAVAELQQLYKAMHLNEGAPSISYCNSGHLASGGWFIQHELLGNKNVKLYDGSMHEWTLEKRPVKAMVME
jgi:thiosulfate/3-mercaptopyruvate sulfurtransferase